MKLKNRKIEKSMKTKVGPWEKINKIDKPITRLSKK